MPSTLSTQQREALQEIVKQTSQIALEGTLMQKAAETPAFTMNAVDVTAVANRILHCSGRITEALKQLQA